MSMYCNQCEQAANGTGCNISGVCGKKPDVAALQDHLIHGLRSLALFADKLGRDKEIDRFTIDGLFTTVTNVDFEAGRIAGMIIRCYETAGIATSGSIILPRFNRRIEADFGPCEIKTFRVPADSSLPVVETNLIEWQE